jgi:hypothetical protein
MSQSLLTFSKRFDMSNQAKAAPQAPANEPANQSDKSMTEAKTATATAPTPTAAPVTETKKA